MTSIRKFRGIKLTRHSAKSKHTKNPEFLLYLCPKNTTDQFSLTYSNLIINMNFYCILEFIEEILCF